MCHQHQRRVLSECKPYSPPQPGVKISSLKNFFGSYCLEKHAVQLQSGRMYVMCEYGWLHFYWAIQLFPSFCTAMLHLMLLSLVSREVWLVHGVLQVSRSVWFCQLRLLVCSFTFSPLPKQVWGNSRDTSAALVNCHCCKEKDVVTAGLQNESGGSRCLT